MTTLTTLECPFPFRPRVRGRPAKDRVPQPPRVPSAAERVPRIARLMALAWRFEELLRKRQDPQPCRAGTLGPSQQGPDHPDHDQPRLSSPREIAIVSTQITITVAKS